MKKIISLIISASIVMQMVIPATSLVTYAQTPESAYGFQWENNKRLDENLDVQGSNTDSTEALVSWDVEDETNKYILEYMVEEENGVNEKVRFTFNREVENRANVKIEVLDPETLDPKDKIYNEFDFDKIGQEGNWKEPKGTDALELDVVGNSPYPGGRVRVGSMDIRFRWKGNKVHFQTSHIKHGNITPFSLTYAGSLDVTATVDILTGIKGFKVSPVHLEVKDGEITSKDTIAVPGEGDQPGSKPGIMINFQRPKQWKDGKIVTLEPDEAEGITATLVLEDLTDAATAQLSFHLGKEAKISGLDKEKDIIYDQITGVYTLYLAQDDEEEKNIIKWETLNESMVFRKIELSLLPKEAGKPSLGKFTPSSKGKDSGGHTYLGYTIHRSSIDEAYIEVQPYNGGKNTEYTYTVESSPDGGTWTDLVQHKYVSIGGKTEKSFTIPIPFSANYPAQYYKVTAQSKQVIMPSQILHYQPDQDLTIPPPTPVIQSVDNIYAVPPKKLGDQPETIGFDLTWSAPKNVSPDGLLDQLLGQGNIFYELFLHDDLESTEEGRALSKVFKVSLRKTEDNKDEVYVEDYAGTAGKNPAEVRYNPIKDTFTMENVVLKNLEKTGWERIKIEDKDYSGGTQYPEKSELTEIDDMENKEVPGIHYITMRALYATTSGAITMGVSTPSNPKSITISPLDEVIPVPTKMESKPMPDEYDADRIMQTFSWGNIAIDRYIKQMLDPLNLSVAEDGKGVYELYLYQEKNISESEIVSTSPAAINLNIEKSYELKDGDRKALREDGVVRLDYKGLSSEGMNSILLDGLDANQVYYMKVRVRLDIKDQEKKDLEARHSVFSKEHSFTSSIKPSEPGPGERVPPVPEGLELIDQPNNTTAKIGWEAPDYTKQEGEELYYEMLRVDSRVLAKEEDSRLFSIKDLFGGTGKDELHAWRTKGPFVDQYVKGSDTWTEAIPKQASNKLQLEDGNLSPNEIYYYYVRTVLVVDGEEVYSSWVGMPVTTDPIQKPIMLKVEDEANYSHDPKREIVISFLAPIPKGSKVPEEYDFDIAVQGELDDNYRLDYSTTRLTSKQKDEDIPTGYSHFVYKINQVKPGKRYDIKVRTIDKTIDQVNGHYPKSLYSGRVTTRTLFDQDEQDKDDKFEQYLKYFEDKAEALRRKAYWELDQGSGFSAKYRSNYLIPEINSSKTVQLAVKEGVSDFTYYMPASVIASSNLSQSGFEIKQGDVTYSVRPSTITTELEEVKEAVLDISEKHIKDYYISFKFSQIPNGNPDEYLTPKMIVDIELIRLKEEDLIVEDDIMVALNEEIAGETVRFIKDLEKALEKGTIRDEELDAIATSSIGVIEKKHQKDVRKILDRHTRKVVSISQWNKNMLIMARIEGRVTAEGYKLGLEDTPLTTFNVSGGYGIEINQPGTYVFKGQKINVPIIPGIGDTGDLVVKYQLMDFFGTDGNINPNDKATKKDVLGAMARVLGAPRGSDYIQYLKQKNVKGITNIGMNLPLKKGEGVYLLMQVYEQVHKKPIASVHIKNRGAVNNLRQFNQIHQPYVLVAVDSKLVSQGSGIDPNDTMEVKNVLQLLDNIMKVVR